GRRYGKEPHRRAAARREVPREGGGERVVGPAAARERLGDDLGPGAEHVHALARVPRGIAGPEPLARLRQHGHQRRRLHRQRGATARLRPRVVYARRVREQRVIEVDQQRLHARPSAATARAWRGSRTRSASRIIAAVPPSAAIMKTAGKPAPSASRPPASGATKATGASEV